VFGDGRLGRVLACIAAGALGLALSLFTAGPALFSDGSFSERPPVLAASVVAFAVLGAALGFVAPGAWKPAAVCLALSAVPVAVFLGRDLAGQAPMMLLSAGFMLGDAAAGVFGVWAGARLRRRRRGPA
jgi:hypothetical protein